MQVFLGVYDMNDYLEIFHQYKEHKDIVDLIHDIQKLRYYYSTQQFDLMHQHISNLTAKYSFETTLWNAVNTTLPNSYQEAYLNAENFLKVKGFAMLIKKGYQISQN